MQREKVTAIPFSSWWFLCSHRGGARWQGTPLEGPQPGLSTAALDTAQVSLFQFCAFMPPKKEITPLLVGLENQHAKPWPP